MDKKSLLMSRRRLSAAMAALVARGGEGIFIDFVNDSVAIVDSGTPANNYDGNVAGSPIAYQGSVTTGANGGKIVEDFGVYVKFPVSAFPYDATQGSLGVECIPAYTGATTFAEYLILGSLDIRTGAGANWRLVANGNLDNGTRVYAGIPLHIAGSYDGAGASTAHDGGLVNSHTTPVNAGSPTDMLMGSSGVGAYAEILRAWYIPTRLSDIALSTSSRPTVIRTLYADANTGNDSDDGLSEANAKLTIAGLNAVGAKVRSADIVKWKGRFHESPITLPSLDIRATDPTNKPVIDGSRLISNGAWAADGTYANVYKATITHGTAIGAAAIFYPQILYGNLIGRDRNQLWSSSTTSLTIGTGSKVFTVTAGRDFQVGDRVFIRDKSDDDNFMYGTVTAYTGTSLTVTITTIGGSGTLAAWTVRVTTELIGTWPDASDSAVNRAALTPGRFTCHIDGLAVGGDPHLTNAQTYVYYIYLPDSSNPASATNELAYAEWHNIITLSGGENLSDIIVQRTSAKDMINKNMGNFRVTTNRCELLDAAAHAIVCSPITHTSDIAVGLKTSRDQATGGGFHFFRDEVSEGTAAACYATDCIAIAFGPGFYSHGTGGGDEQVSVTLQSGTSIDCGVGIQTGKTTLGWDIHSHTYVNCQVNSILSFPADTEV